MKTHKRSIKLIRPGLQLRIAVGVLGLTAVALLFQSVLLSTRLPQLGLDEGVMSRMGSWLTGALVLSLVVTLPLVACFGILFSFRIAGPLHHLEQFLAAVNRGEQSEPCHLRGDDELRELCELINAATEEARRTTAAEEHSEEDLDPAECTSRAA